MTLRSGAASLQDKRYRQLIRALETVRLEAGLTQTEVAEALGLSQNAISRVENFDRRLDALEFLLWCKICRVTPDEVARV